MTYAEHDGNCSHCLIVAAITVPVGGIRPGPWSNIWERKFSTIRHVSTRTNIIPLIVIMLTVANIHDLGVIEILDRILIRIPIKNKGQNLHLNMRRSLHFSAEPYTLS
jgi:hypothetical protein